MKEVLEEIKTNNTEALKTAEKEVKKPEYVDTKKLAAEAIAADVELKAAISADKVVSGQEAEKIQKGIEAEKADPEKQSSERRRAYMQAGFKLIAAALEAELKKGLIGRGFVSKKEIQECLDSVNARGEHLETNQEVDSVNWEVVLTQAKFLEKKNILPQLEALKTEYLKPEDFEKVDPQKEKMENQIKSSSMGASGDRVQF